MPLVERRYVEALVNISVQGGVVEIYCQQFQSIVNLLNEHKDFKFFLLNPEIKKDAKKEIVKKLFIDEIKVELVNFILLLIDKGRIKLLPGILKEFIKLADKERNVLNMIIISAAPIEEMLINELKDKYTRIYKASSIKARVEIDKKLIGGIKVMIGDNVADGTVKGRLESLKEALVRS